MCIEALEGEYSRTDLLPMSAADILMAAQAIVEDKDCKYHLSQKTITEDLTPWGVKWLASSIRNYASENQFENTPGYNYSLVLFISRLILCEEINLSSSQYLELAETGMAKYNLAAKGISFNKETQFSISELVFLITYSLRQDRFASCLLRKEEVDDWERDYFTVGLIYRSMLKFGLGARWLRGHQMIESGLRKWKNSIVDKSSAGLIDGRLHADDFIACTEDFYDSPVDEDRLGVYPALLGVLS